MTISTLGVKDPDVKRAIRAMNAEINALKARLEGVVSQEGTFIANLGLSATKTTTEGEKTVTAGAITILDDTDDLTEGSSNLWLTGAGDSDDLTEGSTKLFVGSSGSGDLDDVDDGTTYKRPKGVNVSNEITDASITAGADIAPTKILISGAVNLDDWRDSGDATKIAAAELAGSTPNALNIATTNPQPAGFVRAGAVRAMNAIGTDGVSIEGNIVDDVTGADDGASVIGVTVPTGAGNSIDTSATGGGGTGEGGDPLEP